MLIKDRHAVAQSDEALRQKRKVAGSIPDGVTEIFFYLHNLSGRNMAQPITEIGVKAVGA